MLPYMGEMREGARALELRRDPRKPVAYQVEFTNSLGERMSGICRDVSVGGMHIETSHPAPFGSKVTIYMQFKGMRAPAALPGIVRWIRQNEMGVQFGLLGARETHAITSMLGEI